MKLCTKIIGIALLTTGSLVISMEGPGVRQKKLNKELIQAVMSGDKAKMIKLINQGADIHSKEGFFESNALMQAASFGREDLVKFILKQKFLNINEKDERLMTALMYALEADEEDIAELILQHSDKVEIDAQSNKLGLGETALIIAARHGLLESVKLLLSKGADTTFKNNFGKTALDQAKEAKKFSHGKAVKKNYDAIIKLLKKSK